MDLHMIHSSMLKNMTRHLESLLLMKKMNVHIEEYPWKNLLNGIQNNENIQL